MSPLGVSKITMRAWCLIPFALLALLNPASAEEWRISTSGLGPAKIGMTVACAAGRVSLGFAQFS